MKRFFKLKNIKFLSALGETLQHVQGERGIRICLRIVSIAIFCLLAPVAHAHELLFLDNLKRAVHLDEQMFTALAEDAEDESAVSPAYYGNDLPLFTAYPGLNKSLAYVPLGTLPTPVEQCAELESAYAIQNLFVKQDSVSGAIDADGIQLFGGNKVRKLEFLLADALRYWSKSVLTFGCIGSNHATATATYAARLGLRCYLMLNPQPYSPIVQRNLALMRESGADIIFSRNRAHRTDNTVEIFMQSKATHGDYPYFIPTGGSTAVGIVGFVNAAFELRDQINKGLLPVPDYIYVAAGSFGTVAGLSLGLKAAGISSEVIAVCVEPEEFPGEVAQCIDRLFKETNELLHKYDATFPLFKTVADNVTIIHGFGGTQYGLCTQEAYNAIDDAQKYENIYLDGTYTGKAFAALRAHGQCGMLKNKNVLFWNTFCAEVHGAEN